MCESGSRELEKADKLRHELLKLQNGSVHEVGVSYSEGEVNRGIGPKS